MARARKALQALLAGMLANDDRLNDDKKVGGSTVPTADDYNVLFDLVLDACRKAGIDTSREG